MRSDLDDLMSQRGLDAAILPDTEESNLYRDYLSGGVHANGLMLKKRGAAPVMIVSPMEIDEANKSGLQVLTYDDFNQTEIRQKYGRNTFEETIALWERILDRFDIRGTISLYGITDYQNAMRMLHFLNKGFEGRVTVIRDKQPDIFSLASQTKDAAELELMRDVGRRSSAVMRDTRDWLSTHRIQGEQVVDHEGQPLTIGAVKRFIRLKLLEYDLEDPKGQVIFAQGRDAGVPHSRGEADDILRPGESIVFDLFPRPIGGGYHHDMTRTWCLGYAREDVQRDFDLVQDVYFRSLEEITLGESTRGIDRFVCQRFEAAGHPTKMNFPDTQEGYVHSLGHGLGLKVHEAPSISQFAPEGTVFKAGHVITIEPGLYYPSRGYGIRLEDTIYLDESGQVHNLTDCPYDLVVPLAQ